MLRAELAKTVAELVPEGASAQARKGQLLSLVVEQADAGLLRRTVLYFDNFEIVLDTVAERDGDLLEPEEEEFLEGFRSLPEGARRLYVRL